MSTTIRILIVNTCVILQSYNVEKIVLFINFLGPIGIFTDSALLAGFVVMPLIGPKIT